MLSGLKSQENQYAGSFNNYNR